MPKELCEAFLEVNDRSILFHRKLVITALGPVYMTPAAQDNPPGEIPLLLAIQWWIYMIPDSNSAS